VSQRTAGPGEPIVARLASRQNIRRLARRERLASAIWPIPTILGGAAFAAAAITTTLDEHHTLAVARGRFLVADTNTALTLTSVVATGMLVFLGIVFSTTLVAIQLAASQYSPRAVRVFLRSRLTKVSLGIFVATFVFAVASLLEIRSSAARSPGFTPVLSMALLSLLVVATLVAFLVFANGTARLLRVQYLIERIAEETRPAITFAFPADEQLVHAVHPTDFAGGAEIDAGARTGVLDAVDIGGLAELGRRAGGWIELLVPIGTYIGADLRIAIVHAARTPAADDVRRCLLLSNERTVLLDPGSGVRQLVDIAIRALSPAVNDPTTAVQVIDRIGDLLARVADRSDPTEWYVDDETTARLRLVPNTLASVVRLAFVEIIRYGVDSPQVERRLRAVFEQLELRSEPTVRAAVIEMHELLDIASATSALPGFAEVRSVADPRGLG